MASQSLYRKWRSQTFDDLVGQEEIVRTLKNALKSGNLGHAYLFTGPRGTGKTSTARLLAKTVNCERPRDGEPCNECLQCREITAGNSFNVIEIDAASNRGIDNIRELRDRIMVPPSTGKYKVYVLDEAHMLTTEAFNALLKTLEEPPAYAIFVMATTDVHKMLPTVLSRCQRFDFKRITTRQIVARLNFVAEQEQVKLERSAAELIARAAAGGMRDALSLLDQAIAYAGNEISLAQIQSMLGVADPRAIVKFITSIADLDSSAVLHLINELSEAGADLRQVNSQVMEYWRALMLTRAGADAAAILDLTEDEMHDIKQLSQRFALEELTECARVFAQNELMQKNQGTPQLGLELAALECIDVHRRAQAGQLSTGVALTQTQAARPVISPPLTQADIPTRVSQPMQAPRNTASRQAEVNNAPAEKGRHRQEEIQPSPVPQEAAVAQSGAQSSLTVPQVISAWENVRKRTRQKSKSGMLSAYLGYYKIVGVEGSTEQPVVVIQAEKLAHFKYVRDENRYKDLEWALEMEFSLPCQVRLVPPDQSPSVAPMRDSAVYSISAALTPQPSAYREPPMSPIPSSSPAPQVEQNDASIEDNGNVPPQKNAPPIDLYADTPAASDSSALARTNVVRENKQGASQETLEQKVRRDPVVQEVMRTFTARIVDIYPK